MTTKPSKHDIDWSPIHAPEFSIPPPSYLPGDVFDRLDYYPDTTGCQLHHTQSARSPFMNDSAPYLHTDRWMYRMDVCVEREPIDTTDGAGTGLLTDPWHLPFVFSVPERRLHGATNIHRCSRPVVGGRSRDGAWGVSGWYDHHHDRV